MGIRPIFVAGVLVAVGTGVAAVQVTRGGDSAQEVVAVDETCRDAASPTVPPPTVAGVGEHERHEGSSTTARPVSATVAPTMPDTSSVPGKSATSISTSSTVGSTAPDKPTTSVLPSTTKPAGGKPGDGGSGPEPDCPDTEPTTTSAVGPGPTSTEPPGEVFVAPSECDGDYEGEYDGAGGGVITAHIEGSHVVATVYPVDATLDATMYEEHYSGSGDIPSTGRIDAVNGNIHIVGSFDPTTCRASGTWQYLEYPDIEPGTWSTALVEPDRG